MTNINHNLNGAMRCGAEWCRMELCVVIVCVRVFFFGSFSLLISFRQNGFKWLSHDTSHHFSLRFDEITVKRCHNVWWRSFAFIRSQCEAYLVGGELILKYWCEAASRRLVRWSNNAFSCCVKQNDCLHFVFRFLIDSILEASKQSTMKSFQLSLSSQDIHQPMSLK